MLILTRKPSQKIMIGEEVTVTILGVRGNEVKIGVSAPKKTSILRDELLGRISTGLPLNQQDYETVLTGKNGNGKKGKNGKTGEKGAGIC